MSIPKHKFGKAWIIRWRFYGMDEKKQLEKLGIKNAIVDFLNSRKTFEFVEEYVKTLYRLQMLSFSERAYLEDYKRGEKNKSELFGKSIPIFTHYQTPVYRDLMRCTQEKGLDDSECRALVEKLAAIPPYISVGHNPSLEGKQVRNLRVFKDGWTNVLEWDETLGNGSERHETHRMN